MKTPKFLELVILNMILVGLVKSIEYSNSEVIPLEKCEDKCNNHGYCQKYIKIENKKNLTEKYNEFFVCKCESNFVGNSCNSCQAGRFGKNCDPCPNYPDLCSGNGICDQGYYGSGKCICNEGYSQESNCTSKISIEKDSITINLQISLLLFAAIVCVLVIFTCRSFPIFHLLPDSLTSIFLGFIIGIILKYSISEESEMHVGFIPKAYFLILLPPIMFEAGFSLDKITFFKNLGTILIFACFGTIISCLSFGFIVFLSGVCRLTYQISFLESMMFGGLISSVDPVATLAIFRALKVDHTLYMLVFGESALNDAVAISLFRIFSNLIISSKSGGLLFVESIYSFVLIFFGSIIVGVSIAMISSGLLKYINFSKYPQIELALFALFCYLPFPVCEGIGLSGIISILFSGICMGHFAHFSLSPMNQITSENLIKSLCFASEQFCFVYLGIELPYVFKEFSFSLTLISIIALLSSRALEIYPLTKLCNKYREVKLKGNHKFIMWFSGLRGAVSFALAMDFPTSNHGLICSTTLVTIVFTIVILGGGTLPLLRYLNVSESLPITKEITNSYNNNKEKELKELHISDNSIHNKENINIEIKEELEVLGGKSFKEKIVDKIKTLEIILRKSDWLNRKRLSSKLLTVANT